MLAIYLSLLTLFHLSMALVTPPPPVTRHRWKGFCTPGDLLTAPYVDAAVQSLLHRTGGAGLDVKSDDHNQGLGEKLENIFVYTCTDGHGDDNHFTSDDIHRGLAAMDANCPRYKPSWAILETNSGSGWKATNKIVGKAWEGTLVCQGENGGMLSGDNTGGNAIYF